jgi:hypothetical protein
LSRKRQQIICLVISRKKVKKYVDFTLKTWYITYALAKKCLFNVKIKKKVKEYVDINEFS